MTYFCTNAFCEARYHYTPRCPYPGYQPIVPPPRRGPLTDADRRALAYFGEQVAAGAFDLRQPYRHLLNTGEKPVEDPGHRWLLVFIPIALILAALMFALVVL